MIISLHTEDSIEALLEVVDMKRRWLLQSNRIQHRNQKHDYNKGIDISFLSPFSRNSEFGTCWTVSPSTNAPMINRFTLRTFCEVDSHFTSVLTFYIHTKPAQFVFHLLIILIYYISYLGVLVPEGI